MIQPPNKIFVLPQAVAPAFSQQDMQQYVKLQNKLIESYVDRSDSQNEQAWLEKELARLNPSADSAYIKQSSADILNTLASMWEKDERINLLRQKGIKDEARLTTELFEQTKNMSKDEANAFFNDLAKQINESNQRNLNTFNTYAGLSPDVLENSTSNQYAVLSEIARFNAQAKAENTGLRAVLDETMTSPQDPFGQVKILNNQNQVVDVLSIRYEEGPSTDNQSQVQAALEKLRSSCDANNPEQMPFGVRVDLPNGGYQDVYVGIPRSSEHPSTSSRVLFKNKAEFSPFNDYFAYTGNVPATLSPAAQSMMLSMVAIQDIPRNFPQYLKKRAKEIAHAISQTALFTFDYGRYAKIAGGYAYQGAMLTAKAAKFVLESLMTGAVHGLQVISSVALKCGLFAWTKVKEFDYVHAAIVAGSCIAACASVVQKACVGLFNVGSKIVKTITDKVSVLSKEPAEDEYEPASDLEFDDNDVVEKKKKKRRRRKKNKSTQDMKTNELQKERQNVAQDEETNEPQKEKQRVVQYEETNEPQKEKLNVDQDDTLSAVCKLELPFNDVLSSNNKILDEKDIDSITDIMSKTIGAGIRALPFFAGLGPVGSIVLSTVTELGSSLLNNTLKDLILGKAKKAEDKNWDIINGNPNLERQIYTTCRTSTTIKNKEKNFV